MQETESLEQNKTEEQKLAKKPVHCVSAFSDQKYFIRKYIS